MTFDLRVAEPHDRLPLQRMLELYQHDLSDIWDQDLDAHGEYGYALDEYWERRDCNAWIITAGGRYAGFALVTGRIKLPGADHWLEQFCVLKKYRRRGIGRGAALALFDRVPGVWQVGQMPRNHAAQAFWRATIGAYTGGDHTETSVTSGWWQGVLQQFTAPR